jgi:hypothetical protein
VLSRGRAARALDEEPRRDVESARGLALVALDPQARDGAKPLWFRGTRSREDDDLPEVSIGADQRLLYLVRGAWLEVRDGLTGRALGDWTVPGLDERIAWTVCQGAGRARRGDARLDVRASGLSGGSGKRFRARGRTEPRDAARRHATQPATVTHGVRARPAVRFSAPEI